jgi:sterol desaturase/sphingolipid hydroxylase (fatty acid hydroxylase superfamily)
MPNYVAFAIPFFFTLMGIELLVARRRQRTVYRFNDAVVDLSTGVTQQVLLIFQKAAMLAIYMWLYERRWMTLSSSSLLVWIGAFVLNDVAYYWWHRLSHEINFLWAAHVVHHQSEDYNLAVALRQSIATPWTLFPFHLPFALLGVPPLVFIAADSFNTLYQFWIHTELVGKLGWFEKVFNTPSLHRVHHGINPRYLDKNYGGIFMVWDALFGTLELETEPVVFGLVKPLKNFNPIWVQVHHYFACAKVSMIAPRALDKLRIWLKPPPWMPEGLPQFDPPPEVSPQTFHKYDPQVPAGFGAYLFAQLVSVLVCTTVLMFHETSLPWSTLAFWTGVILLAVLTWGGFFEHRGWALPLERVRLAFVGLGALAQASQSAVAGLSTGIGVAVFAVVSALWLSRYQSALTAQSRQQ